MKISELIAYLSQIQERYGDLDVVAYKNQQFLGDLEKIVRFEAYWHAGPLPPKTTAEERQLYKSDPQMQPNAGWLPFEPPAMDRQQFKAKLEQKLFLGSKLTVY